MLLYMRISCKLSLDKKSWIGYEKTEINSDVFLYDLQKQTMPIMTRVTIPVQLFFYV